MRRRALLAATATASLASLAGCTGLGSQLAGNGAYGPTARLSMTALSDAALPREVLYTVGAEDGPDDRAHLLDRILDGGATVRKTRPPLPAGNHLLYEGTVYRLEKEIIERTPATRFSVLVDIVQGTVVDGASIRFSELPSVDKQRFEAHGLADGDPVGIGTTFLYSNADVETSVLVPDSTYDYVVWANGAEAEWIVDDSYETTINTYRYTAATVADAAEYGRRMRECFAFGLSDLAPAEQDIVETAIDTEYVVGEDETPSEAFRSLGQRLRSHERAHALDSAPEEDFSPNYLVRYDGEVYWTSFMNRVRDTGTESGE